MDTFWCLRPAAPLGERQLHVEGAATAGHPSRPELPTLGFNEAAAELEPDTVARGRAARLAAAVPSEQGVRRAGVESDSLIADDDECLVLCPIKHAAGLTSIGVPGREYLAALPSRLASSWTMRSRVTAADG